MGCEDASGVVDLRGREGVIAAVADGHGDVRYVRSGRGARLAVEAATRVLQGFVDDGGDPTDEAAIARLKCELVEAWAGACRRDLEEDPLSERELEALPVDAREAEATELYGTTLLAALCTDAYLLLLQQGDGCAALLSEAGQWAQPVPDDPLCVGNVTTSLSDDDAAQRMRHALVACGPSAPLACVLMTDGVEKAAVAQEGLWDVLDVIALAREDGARLGEPLLEEAVRELSMGTGDDASVACVGAPMLPSAVSEALRARHERYASESEAQQIRAKLVSMSRKHDRLEQLWQSGERDKAAEYPRVHATYEALQERLRELEGDRGAMPADRDEGAAAAGVTTVLPAPMPSIPPTVEAVGQESPVDAGVTTHASPAMRTTMLPPLVGAPVTEEPHTGGLPYEEPRRVDEVPPAPAPAADPTPPAPAHDRKLVIIVAVAAVALLLALALLLADMLTGDGEGQASQDEPAKTEDVRVRTEERPTASPRADDGSARRGYSRDGDASEGDASHGGADATGDPYATDDPDALATKGGDDEDGSKGEGSGSDGTESADADTGVGSLGRGEIAPGESGEEVPVG